MDDKLEKKETPMAGLERQNGIRRLPAEISCIIRKLQRIISSCNNSEISSQEIIHQYRESLVADYPTMSAREIDSECEVFVYISEQTTRLNQQYRAQQSRGKDE